MTGAVRFLEPWVIADGERVPWNAVGVEAWEAGSLAARMESGTLGTRLVVTNQGGRAVRLQAAFLRWEASAETLRIGFFESRWGCENQLRWIEPIGAGLELRHPPGRTGEGNPTHAMLRLGARARAWVAVPRGDLLVRLRPCGPFLGPHGSPRSVQVWIGPPPEGLSLAVPPGGSLEIAEVMELDCDDGQLEVARWISRACRAAWGPTRECPVIWNTWLDRFDELEPERLLRQLDAAAEVGCEGLVVDAGWFGSGTGWWDAVGDWEECREGAFRGRMAHFAERVRSAGMFFGLWMEPERVAPRAPIRRARRDWVSDSGRLRLELSDAFDWLLETTSSRIREYGVEWLKVDMNFSLGDAAGDAHRAHREALHLWLRTIRARFPSLYLEGCSSGAMRLDLDLLPAFDQHFLSDNTNPWDVARIAEGAAWRVPLDRIGRWAVLYERGGELLAPKTAGLDGRETVTVPFAVAPAFLGAFGISGDLASLGSRHRGLLAACVSAYKRVRTELARSELRSVSPPRPRGDRSGWSWQAFRAPTAGLLSAMRLEDSREERLWSWSELLDGAGFGEPEVLFADEGARVELRDEGLAVILPKANSAAVLRLPIL